MGRKDPGLSNSAGSTSYPPTPNPHATAVHANTPVLEATQAIIIADSFDCRFSPITLEIPRCLMQVVNLPLLSYTVEWLAAAGVSEIFVFTRSHSKKIAEWTAQVDWAGVSVRCFEGEDCNSLGDALRFMCEQEVIKTDFVLVSGDVVSNMQLKEVLTQHRARRRKDPNAIMTMIFKHASPTHRTRSKEDATVIAVDHITNQLLHYQNEREQGKFQLDTMLFKDHMGIRLRYDLIDCRIDICSPDVLLLFGDNFDFKDLRQDFVRGVLASELLGNKIFTEVINGEYAARVNNLSTYLAVSKDIIHRWSYPMVPDNNILGTTKFTRQRGFNYREDNVRLAQSCVMGNEVVIGSRTSIGAASEVASSIIGRACNIGKNVKITDSVLWDHVTVEDGCVIEMSLICNNVKIQANTKVEKGCVISTGVEIGPGAIINSQTRLTTLCPSSEEWEGKEITEKSIGNAYRWILQDDDITNSLLAYYHPPETEQPVSEDENDDESQNEEEEKGKRFVDEVSDIFRDGVEKKKNLTDLKNEINICRLAHDADVIECIFPIVTVFLAPLLSSPKMKEKKQLITEVKKLFVKWAPLIKQFTGKKPADQVELIFQLELVIEEEEYAPFASVFMYILWTLYEKDVITEEAVFLWEKEHLEEDSDNKIVALCKQFIEWLKNAEEESD